MVTETLNAKFTNLPKELIVNCIKVISWHLKWMKLDWNMIGVGKKELLVLIWLKKGWNFHF